MKFTETIIFPPSIKRAEYIKETVSETQPLMYVSFFERLSSRKSYSHSQMQQFIKQIPNFKELTKRKTKKIKKIQKSFFAAESGQSTAKIMKEKKTNE